MTADYCENCQNPVSKYCIYKKMKENGRFRKLKGDLIIQTNMTISVILNPFLMNQISEGHVAQ
jgi:hypothetical protein